MVVKLEYVLPFSRWPSAEGQVNFDALNAPYAITSEGLIVLVDHGWTLFELHDNLE